MIAEAAIEVRSSAAEATVLLDSVAAAMPEERRNYAYALRALLASRDTNREATDRFIALSEKNLSTTDADTRRILGRLLLEQGQGESTTNGTTAAGTWTKSRAFYGEAHRLAPNELESCWGFSLTSFITNTEVPAALDTLSRCHQRAPNSAEFNHALAVGNGMTGNLQGMRNHLVYAVRYSRDPASRTFMRGRLQVLDKELRERGLLAE